MMDEGTKCQHEIIETLIRLATERKIPIQEAVKINSLVSKMRTADLQHPEIAPNTKTLKEIELV